MRKSGSKTTQKEQQESIASTLESGKPQISNSQERAEEASQYLDEASADLNLKEVSNFFIYI